MWLKLLLLTIGAILVVGSAVSPRKSIRASQLDDKIPFMDLEKDTSILPLLDPHDGISYRLPNTTTPLAYNIWISTDIHRGEFGFNGQVIIRILVLETTREITLQYRMMTIEMVSLFDSNNNLIQNNVPFYQNETVEFLVMTPNQQLTQGQEYFVSVRYNGTIRDDGLGLHRGSYVNPAGDTAWFAATQFSATQARHAFPCYDEPMIRSQFSLSVRHHGSYIVRSNTEIEDIIYEPGTQYVLTRFEESFRMQTFLVAFTISDFFFAFNLTVTPRQRIYARYEAITNGDAEMALQTSVRQMQIMEDYIGISYQFRKMDQVATPNFRFAAMENTGLILYSEQFLLWNPVLDRTRDRDNVIVVNSHVFIHQWFGSLVGPAWWSYLWITEGLATLYEFFIPQIAYPENRYMDTFLIEYMHIGLENDADPNVRAMTHYVENPDRIADLSDLVAFNKAGGVLYMLQNALGHETWRRGINYFLIDRQDNFTTPAHFYAGIQQGANEFIPDNTPDVLAIMSTWELQAGVPIITVSRVANVLNLHQTRFFYTNQTSDFLWHVPINYVVGSNPNFSETTPDLWLTERQVDLQSNQAPKPWQPNDWIVVNIQQSGYYRVNYDNGLWSLIIEQLNGPQYDVIHVLNRLQLIDDSFHVARSGRITHDIPLDILNYLERETHHTPWASGERALTLYNRWLLGTPVYDEFQAYVLKNVAAMYNKLGVTIINNEPRQDRFARQIAINLACLHGSSQCLTDTATQLNNMINSQQALHPDVVAQIYCNGLRRSNATVVQAMNNILSSATRQIERNRIISAFGCIENSEILQGQLLLALQPGSLSNAERSNILTSPLNNGIDSLLVLVDFIRLNYGGINLINVDLVSTLCSNIAIRISTEEVFDEFISLLPHLELNGAISTETANTLRISAQNILDWQEENLEHITRFFERQTALM